MLAAAVLGLVAAAPLAAAAQTFPGPPSIEQLARRADLVVLGEVRAVVGEWDASRRNILTRVELAHGELLKGAAALPVTFTHLGGRVDGQTSVVGGAVAFEPGERVLVFLARRPDGSLHLAELLHGAFTIQRDAATGRDDAVRAAERVELEHARALIRRASGAPN